MDLPNSIVERIPPMTASIDTRAVTDQATETLRKAGNPFRNYFARNPDDETCSRYHVPELFATERSQLLGVVNLYRAGPGVHSEVVPVLGNKGAGKTHLLHSIKHGTDGAWQLLVTPGIYQKDAEFLEYLLFQVIDTLLGGGRQKGMRPLAFVGEELTRVLLRQALEALTPAERLELFPVPGFGRWTKLLGLGNTQAQERTQWLCDMLKAPKGSSILGKNDPQDHGSAYLRRLCTEASLDPERAYELLTKHIEKTQAHNTAGLMRRHLHQGFARAALLGDESELASFVTFGFAELEFHVRPSRQDLVLSLFKVLMEVFLSLKIPVVVAFDQLEDLLLARRNDEGHRAAEAFFAGIVQAMHQIDGICFLIFAERGLWNRFVPSLDGYIQDRLNNPVHVPGHGTIKALRLEAPAPELVRRVVEARLAPALAELTEETPSPLYPFTEEQVTRIAKTEPTLRDMLQQFRHAFDKMIYGTEDALAYETPANRVASPRTDVSAAADQSARLAPRVGSTPEEELQRMESSLSQGSDSRSESPTMAGPVSRLPGDEYAVKSMIVVNSAGESTTSTPAPRQFTSTQLAEMWEQELQAARDQLSPEGALAGAARELQAGLGAFLQTCHEHGVKVGPWRLHHVVGEWTFGDHPTYGAVTIAHWVCKDGQPWKVGIGLFLGRGNGKPRDLEQKLLAMEAEPPVIDVMILLRPSDDVVLSGKSKTLWQEAERRGRHARLEAVNVDGFAALYAFPRWLTALAESLPQGQELPNLADLLQERCEKLLEQVCMPVQQ
jgi:hypothetical protein